MDAVQMWEMLLTSSNPMVSMDQSVQIYREAHGFCTMIRSEGPFTRAIAFSNARDACVVRIVSDGYDVEYYGSTPIELQAPQAPLHVIKVKNYEDLARVMSVIAYCYLLMLYYSTTKTDMAIISIRMDNPRFRHYVICIAVLTIVASLADLTALIATLGIFGAYRRYIFETPPKKRVKQAVTKLAEAL